MKADVKIQKFVFCYFLGSQTDFYGVDQEF